MAYELSNGHVTDDITLPWKVKLMTPIRLERNISKTAGDTDSETLFQRTTNRKWPVGYQMVTWPRTSRDPQRCCEVVRSAILATAWLLVKDILTLFHICIDMLSRFFPNFHVMVIQSLNLWESQLLDRVLHYVFDKFVVSMTFRLRVNLRHGTDRQDATL